jgi:hypothetical protein
MSSGIVAIMAIAAASVLSSLAPSHAAALPGHAVIIHIDTATIVGKIPEDFVGFGYETSAVAQKGFFSGKNSRMINLYRNLGRHGLIRIGGNVSDHTRFVSDGTPQARTEREVTVINQENLRNLGDFVRATGWHVMWGLNLGTGTKEQAADEAVAVDRALGPNLQSFEIGNEVDLMRKYAKDYDAYHAAYLEYKAAIRAKLPHAVFSGPDVAGSLGFVEKFVTAESADMALATHHYYRGGAHDPRSTMQRLLTRDDAFEARLEQLRTLCTAHHVNYRINEVNSFFGGGKEGVSDTFASALWCLDYMFDLAAHGCNGVNMETDINQLGFISYYSPIIHNASGVCSARPEYYGILAFAMAGHGKLLKTSVDKGDINLTAYSTKDDHGTIYLTVINKDLTQDASIECRLPEGHGIVEVYRLRSPSIGAKAGVIFGGDAVAEDGTWTNATPESATVNDQIARTTAPHAGAAVLRFKSP